MTSQEITDAMKARFPVAYNNQEYLYIKEYILTYDDNGEQRRSVSLLDKSKNSLIRVPINQIELKIQEEKKEN